MSLGPEFFEERQLALARYEAEGYVDLTDVVEGIPNWEQALEQLGFIRGRQILSTAELYDWDVTDKGMKFFHQDKKCQLVMVYQDDVAELRGLLD